MTETAQASETGATEKPRSNTTTKVQLSDSLLKKVVAALIFVSLGTLTALLSLCIDPTWLIQFVVHPIQFITDQLQ